MYKLSIRNIGPVRVADLEFRKVCVLIGPQSSGKSTIAKLLSFCLWLGKDMLMRGIKHIDAQFLRQQLLNYHKMSAMFNADSEFAYEGPYMRFKFRSLDDFDLNVFPDDASAKMCRIAYIPAERNFVTIPNISTLELPDNYVRDFIFEWLRLRGKFTGGSSLSLPGLDEAYRYRDGAGDCVVMPDGRQMQLSEASSGLQSIVPLAASVHYNTVWVYENNEDISYEKYTTRLMKVEQLIHPQLTHLIVEEPEQNIFPVTQYEVVKLLVSSINRHQGSTLMMTTHSPYVLTALNNLIQAAERDDNGEQVVGKGVAANYDDVTAYVVQDGTVRSICDDEYRLISAEAIDEASHMISDDFDRLLQ